MTDERKGLEPLRDAENKSRRRPLRALARVAAGSRATESGFVSRYLSVALAVLLAGTAFTTSRMGGLRGQPAVAGTPLNSDSGDPSPAAGVATIMGKTASVGNGTVRSWVRMGEDAKPVAVGVSLSEDALSGLPHPPPDDHQAGPYEYVLEIPPQAGTPFDHVGVNWNPNGHPPSHVYDVSHFDFHFYLVSVGDRMKITAKGKDLARVRKPLPAEYVPEGYVFEPDSEVPGMGFHWVDPQSHEFHGHAFTKTFLYGSYDGKVIFLEPMITKAYLESRPNVTDSIKLPAKYPKPGYYPTAYSVRYDALSREYIVSLEGMTFRR